MIMVFIVYPTIECRKFLMESSFVDRKAVVSCRKNITWEIFCHKKGLNEVIIQAINHIFYRVFLLVSPCERYVLPGNIPFHQQRGEERAQ